MLGSSSSRAVGLFGALVLLAPSPARAQVTGGSFGSSDWGHDSHDSSSSSGSSWGSTSSDDHTGQRRRASDDSHVSGRPYNPSHYDPEASSSSSSSSSYSSSSSSRPRTSRSSGGFTLFVVLLFVVGLFVLFAPFVVFGLGMFSMVRSKQRFDFDDGELVTVRASHPATPHSARGASSPRLPPSPPSPQRSSAPRARSSQLGVVVLHAGLDARARKPVQDALGTLATTLAPGPEGRLRALHATVALLDAHATSIAYEGTRTHAHLPQVEARGVFARETAELRARFRYELVRADASPGASPSSATPIATPALRPRAEEGEGFVVVSLVVAARGLVAPTSGFDPTAAALVRLDADQLVAFEVIWSPAADADRMSSLELETLYPELRAVRHDVGRVRCVCGVPYAAELASCPSCGRPVAEALRVG